MRTNWQYFKRNDENFGFRFTDEKNGVTTNAIITQGQNPADESICQEICDTLNSAPTLAAELEAERGKKEALMTALLEVQNKNTGTYDGVRAINSITISALQAAKGKP